MTKEQTSALVQTHGDLHDLQFRLRGCTELFYALHFMVDGGATTAVNIDALFSAYRYLSQLVNGELKSITDNFENILIGRAS